MDINDIFYKAILSFNDKSNNYLTSTQLLKENTLIVDEYNNVFFIYTLNNELQFKYINGKDDLNSALLNDKNKIINTIENLDYKIDFSHEDLNKIKNEKFIIDNEYISKLLNQYESIIDFNIYKNIQSIYVNSRNKKYSSNIIKNTIVEIETKKIIQCSNNTILDNEQELILDSYSMIFLKFTNLTIPKNIVALNQFSLFGLFNLKELIINSNIKILDEYVISYNISLNKLVLPDTLEILKEGAISNNYLLTTIDIPKNVKRLENECFSHNINLLNINILGNLLEYIGNLCFEHCLKLTSIDFNTSNIKYIGKYCFYNTNIHDIYLNCAEDCYIDKTTFFEYNFSTLINDTLIKLPIIHIKNNSNITKNIKLQLDKNNYMDMLLDKQLLDFLN